MKTVVIIPYFGKWPVWFELYLYSCSKNYFIDFMFFTDCPVPIKKYKNTIFIESTFVEYCNNVSHTLKINFHPKDPYKLCDLKPFYGLIHQDRLKEYDFWGFGDIDLVYGDLSLIFTSEKMCGKNLFSTHSDRISGHFCLIRNNKKYRELCLQINDWKHLLEDEKHYGLDEGAFTHVMFPLMKYILFIFGSVMRFDMFRTRKWMDLLCPLLFKDAILLERGTTPYPVISDSWIYKDGRMLDMSKRIEIPYLHFLFFKKTKYWKENDDYWINEYYVCPSIIQDSDVFMIDKKGIWWNENH